MHGEAADRNDEAKLGTEKSGLNQWNAGGG